MFFSTTDLFLHLNIHFATPWTPLPVAAVPMPPPYHTVCSVTVMNKNDFTLPPRCKILRCLLIWP